MGKHILITGGSGLIGQRLSAYLLSKGHRLRWLSRNAQTKGPVPVFAWNPRKKQMDEAALDGIDTVINLAGKSLMEGSWSAEAKAVFKSSRLDALETLGVHFKGRKPQLISASAIGFYGSRAETFEVDESSPSGKDYLAQLCVEWEAMAHEVAPLEAAIARVGVVLDLRGGALPQMARPLKLFVGAVPGDGSQGLSWIHYEDISRAFGFLTEQQLSGTFNFTAPQPLGLERFLKILGSQLKRPVWPMHVPAGMMRQLMGEKGDLVTQGAFVRPKALLNAGFEFHYSALQDALASFYSK